MTTRPIDSSGRNVSRALLVMACLAPFALAHAERAADARSLDERRAADPAGEVEVSAIEGSIEFIGWERAEVEVAGTLSDDVDRVDIGGSASRTSIHVVLRPGRSLHGGGAHLVIHVPADSAVAATLVSADLKLSGTRGAATLQTVSGAMNGEVGGELHASTVSGNVRLSAHVGLRLEIRTISGDVHVSGGGGELEITSVSGTIKVDRVAVARGRFKSVSGDLVADLQWGAGAELGVEAVSGDVTLNFEKEPGAQLDVQSFSGAIRNCFGPAPEKSRYGTGSRLAFKSGDGNGRVHVETKSGDVRLCTTKPI